ncbi:MAG: membrane protein [Rhodospirillaceae bacterium BRH_c57]|nr:MAG: membrane protein [Rhodospirillaceae bacterium BRH_c57]
MADHAQASQHGSPPGARGRGAARPLDVPMKGWKDVLFRVKDEITNDNISVVSGGVAFFSLLAIFPAIAAGVAIYGLIASPQDVQQQVQAMSQMMPPEAQGILEKQMNDAAQSSSGAMGFGAIAGILFALWSASKGTKSLVTALNIAYNEEEERGFIKLTLINLGLTLGGLVVAIATLFLVAAVPAILSLIDLGQLWQWVISLSRWPILFLVMLGTLAVLYRVAPDRKPPLWRWISPGAITATLLWILGSIAFSIYVSRFGSYNQTYGAIAGVVILMMWLYLTAFVVLLGAEINSELERQTRVDTTTAGEPMGERGAYSADTLGKRHGK